MVQIVILVPWTCVRCCHRSVCFGTAYRVRDTDIKGGGLNLTSAWYSVLNLGSKMVKFFMVS